MCFIRRVYDFSESRREREKFGQPNVKIESVLEHGGRSDKFIVCPRVQNTLATPLYKEKTLHCVFFFFEFIDFLTMGDSIK